MNWFYAILAFLAFLELVRVRQAFVRIAASYEVWAANTILDIDVTKLTENIEAISRITAITADAPTAEDLAAKLDNKS